MPDSSVKEQMTQRYLDHQNWLSPDLIYVPVHRPEHTWMANMLIDPYEKVKDVLFPRTRDDTEAGMPHPQHVLSQIWGKRALLREPF